MDGRIALNSSCVGGWEVALFRLFNLEEQRMALAGQTVVESQSSSCTKQLAGNSSQCRSKSRAK
jgi:hypothetical protein